MDREQMAGRFEQVKGMIKRKWGELTDDEIMLYEGRQDEFYGKLREKYGIAREEAEAKMRQMEESREDAEDALQDKDVARTRGENASDVI